MIKVLSAVILFLFCLSEISRATDADGQRRLILEAARKEAKMIFYTSVETEFARSLTSAFEAKNPFIKTDIFARPMKRSLGA